MPGLFENLQPKERKMNIPWQYTFNLISRSAKDLINKKKQKSRMVWDSIRNT